MIQIVLLASLAMVSQAVEVCDAADIATFDWDDLISGNAGPNDSPQLVDFDIYVDEDDLTLNIEVKLTYEGGATADDCETADYGTTYVLDFEDFNAHESDIREPGTCQNRLQEHFAGVDFDDLWEYSLTPAEVPSQTHLAYPPANPNWEIYLENDECNVIVYKGQFTWNTLTGCESFGGDSYITTQANGDNLIELSGTFYVNVVGPVGADSDTGFYRVYQLVSQPFLIAINKNVEVLGVAGIDLISISIIAVYKEDSEGMFKLVVLTETAEYLQLTRDGGSIFAYQAAGTQTIVTGDFDAPSETENEGCLDNKEFLCSQLWEISAEGTCVEGDEGASDAFIDFSGTYTLQFTPECREDVSAELNGYCDGWLVDHPTVAGGVSLDATLEWRDDICTREEFEVSFTAEMIFYTDVEYVNVAAEDHLYAIGEDIIYVEVVTDYPTDTFNVFDSELVNVWICTFDPLDPPVMPIEPAALAGGCFDPTKDENVGGGEDGPYFYHIYSIGGANNDPTFTLVGHPSGDDVDRAILQFSFQVPDCIARDSLYIHAQVEVVLGNGDRRRMIASAQGGANQMNHFIENVGTKRFAPNDKKPINVHEKRPNSPAEPSPFVNPEVVNTASPWIKILGAVFALILSVNVVFLCYLKCFKDAGNGRYRSVKVADVDSEEEMAINEQ